MLVSSVMSFKLNSGNVVPVSVGSTQNSRSKASFGYIPTPEQVLVLNKLPESHRRAWSSWIGKTAGADARSGVPSDVVMDAELAWAKVREIAGKLFKPKTIAFWDKAVLKALNSDNDGIFRVNRISRNILHKVFKARKKFDERTVEGHA